MPLIFILTLALQAALIVHVIRTSIWTWVTSLVLRVIKDGAPNCATSRAENEPTL